MSRTGDDTFIVTKAATDGRPRLARFALPGRAIINTPHYLANTSRGVVPHLTQDTLTKATKIAGAYASLEDFIERAPGQRPPVYEAPQQSLRRFLAVPGDKALIVGARRTPPVVPPPATSNTNDSVAVSTSVGFRFLDAAEYARRAESLDADIVVGLVDLPVGRALASKRIEKATDRSIEWTNDHLSTRNSASTTSKYFASLLPVTCANQQYYIDSLIDNHLARLDGLTIYTTVTLEDLPKELAELPRLGLTEAANPLQALQHLQCGVDVLVLPFIDAATDAGLALTFRFPGTGTRQQAQPVPLGEDMWSASHATDLSPLMPACTCYACTKHHRAYVQHLLSAKEMLGWVLLQIHNHHIVDRFFETVRQSISAETFAADVDVFAATYEPRLPEKTGQGPRFVQEWLM